MEKKLHKAFFIHPAGEQERTDQLLVLRQTLLEDAFSEEINMLKHQKMLFPREEAVFRLLETIHKNTLEEQH